MANEEHLRMLQHGTAAWNAWREEHEHISPDLRGANLAGASLDGANLFGAKLNRAALFEVKLSEAILAWADLTRAHLTKANLHRACLNGANLIGADLTEASLNKTLLTGANLTGADLTGADLTTSKLISANLDGANVTDASLQHILLGKTTVSNVDLSTCKGLETVRHFGPSIVNVRTLQRSGPLPLAFLRGVGLPDNFIEYLPSLLNQPIQHYSCFISYSSKDDDFAGPATR